jgi:hypothetical protein
MRQMLTTLGLMDEGDLARTVTFHDRPQEFVIAVEYHYGDELVRRDAHVILKEPSEVATAIVGNTGG